uniref:Uncharacterized protein n=1 Tax=Oryza barthii TaxID=65489 RepID=A0A0D3FMB5_9ORYZ
MMDEDGPRFALRAAVTQVVTTTAFLPPSPRHRPSRPPETTRLRGRRHEDLPSPSRSRVGAYDPDQMGATTV